MLDPISGTPGAWNVSLPNYAAGGHGVIVRDPYGNAVDVPRWITHVEEATSALDAGTHYALRVYPSFENMNRAVMVGSYLYDIYKLPEWQIGSICLYPDERVF